MKWRWVWLEAQWGRREVLTEIRGEPEWKRPFGRRRYGREDNINIDLKMLWEGVGWFNHLTPNGHYMGRTTHLTSRCCILYIYSTNIHTEYFKHAA